MSVHLPPHSPAKRKACHCNPNPHHPCVHTPQQMAKQKAAKAKAAATNAKITALAEAKLRAHPPSKAQIQQAIALAQAHARYAKAHPRKRTAAQVAGIKKAAATRAHNAKKAKQIRAHKTVGANAPAPLPASFLIEAKKSVRAQLAAIAAKNAKHRRKRAKATNPHTQALKRATTRKC